VEKVSWDQAMAFCAKLGPEPDGRTYILPTEAQWEYVCRAGTTGPYAGPSLDELGWYRQNSGSKTHPVGEKRANPWGIHDMHGNIWEWCLDGYGAYPNGQVTDPEGPKQASNRVYRGGGWYYYARNCRSAYRPQGHAGEPVQLRGVPPSPHPGQQVAEGDPGCGVAPEAVRATVDACWHPCRGADRLGIGNRWCRCAQPPATSFHASGMREMMGNGSRRPSQP